MEKIASKILTELERVCPKSENNIQFLHTFKNVVKTDPAEALNWLMSEAQKGDCRAQFFLGVLYCVGVGVKKDDVEAAKWYLAAAQQGHTEGQYNLGSSYYHGNGVEKDYAEAVKWYRAAAEGGHAAAQFNLGIVYCNGYGVKENYIESAKWFKAAAQQGHVTAQADLGSLYHKGAGVGQSYLEAAKWYRVAAKGGDARAQFNIGVFYANGDMGIKQDFTEAVKWYETAAQQGNDNAQFQLGNMYYYGEGVKQSYAQAAKWHRAAADQGHAEAQFCLGVKYDDVEEHESKYMAPYWIKRAANLGHPEAQNKVKEKTRLDGQVVDKHNEFLESTYRPANEISFSLEETKPWESKLGGCPYLEDLAAYPKDTEGEPMMFLAQLNFDEMPPLPDFPKTGILQFFVEDNGAYGLESPFLVKYIAEYKKDEMQLVQQNPYNLNEAQDEPFDKNGKISFVNTMRPICPDHPKYEAKFSDDEQDSLFDFCYARGSRIGGYPIFVQNPPDYYADESIDVLLLQLDIDDVCGVMFGDSGNCTFLISKEDLLKRDFSNVEYDWQCC